MNGFHHEAVFYGSDDEYVSGLLPDLRAAIEADGAILVAVAADKARLLSGALGADADRVRFTDMELLGRNPGLIIPAWREFVPAPPAGGLGIGEPVWPGRRHAELVECRRHEVLLNVAFEASRRGACCARTTPDDAPRGRARRRSQQPPARRRRAVRGATSEPHTVLSWDGRLPAPGAEPAELDFTREDLALVRMFVAERATRAGFAGDRLSDLVLAVNELATNSMRHGGGRGVVQRLAGERRAGLRGDRPRAHRRPAGRPRAPSPTRTAAGAACGSSTTCATSCRCARRGPGNVIRLHMSLDRAF